MLKKMMRILVTLVGAVLGYGVSLLFSFWLTKSGVDLDSAFSQGEQIGMKIVFAIIFGIIFFRLTPAIQRQSAKVADNIGDDLQSVSANELFAGVIGLVTGLLIALLITQIYVSIDNPYLYTVLTIFTYLILGYLGVVIATKKGKEMFSMLVSHRQNTQQDTHFSKGKKKTTAFRKSLIPA